MTGGAIFTPMLAGRGEGGGTTGAGAGGGCVTSTEGRASLPLDEYMLAIWSGLLVILASMRPSMPAEIATVSAVPNQLARFETMVDNCVGVQLAPLVLNHSFTLTMRCATSWVSRAKDLNSETRHPPEGKPLWALAGNTDKKRTDRKHPRRIFNFCT